MDTSIEINPQQFRQVQTMLREFPREIPKVLSSAANDTAKKIKTQMSKAIREEINIKKRDVDRYLKIKRATPASPSASVHLSESERIPLKYFGARQTAKGVGYRVSKKGKRGFIAGAFIVNTLGGHVFKRRGASRLPIIKLFGPSPWGVYVKAGLEKQTISIASKEFYKHVLRRVNFTLLRKAK